MKYLVGNWKMNQSLQDIESFFTDVCYNDSSEVQTWVAPQSIHLDLCARLAEIKNLQVGVQNIAWENRGAFTGEVSPESAFEMGADFAIIGHSERRQYFKESGPLLNKKVKLAQENKLTPIFCIGETLKEREQGSTLSILKSQLMSGLTDVIKPSEIIVAYEPVWAIGTGKVASTKEISEVHQYLKKLTQDAFGEPLALLYGGSVKPKNVKEIMGIKEVDGALVGGASLKAADYNQLFNAMK